MAVDPFQYKVNLTFASSVYFLFFNIYYYSDRMSVAFWAAIFEISLFLLILVLYSVLDRYGPKMLGSVVYAGLFYPCFVANFIYSYFLQEAFVRKVSLFNVGFASMEMFVSWVMPARGLLLMLMSVVGVHVVARWLCGRLRHSRVIIIRASLVIGVVLLLLGSLLTNRSHPVLSTAVEIGEAFSYPRLKTGQAALLPKTVDGLDKSGVEIPPFVSRFRKVLIFILEGTKFEKFRWDTLGKSGEGGFFQTMRPFSHAYTRYYVSNQDSRTGILSMLASVSIPYEAYSRAAVAVYHRVARLRSVVDIFSGSGFSPIYSIAKVEEDIGVTDLHWAGQIRLKGFSRDGGFQCSKQFRFESACEDKILLPQIKEAILRYPRFMLFQEFVWGHGVGHPSTTKESSVRYADGYLKDIYAFLEKEKLTDETLIVVTSDHGPRDKPLIADPHSYQVPLVFIHKNFSGRKNGNLYSQVDFRDILLYELGVVPVLPKEREFVLAVGPTTSSVIAFMTRQKEWGIIRDRGWRTYLLSASDGVDVERAGLLFSVFEEYRNIFESKWRYAE